jgi:hypothetical protein
MRDRLNQYGKWSTIGVCLLFTIFTGCGNDRGRGGSPESGILNKPYIEPYTGPCPAEQTSWDCAAWDKDTWE